MRSRPLVYFATCALLLICGCHRQTRVEQAVDTQTLYVSARDDPGDLDPHTNNSLSTTQTLSTLFEGMVTLSNDGKTILPGVADRWEVSPDGKTYTFHLRSNAVWSNGDPLTAQQCVASFQRIFDPMLGAEQASYGFAIHGARDFAEGRVKDPNTLGLAAPDAHTFVITLDHPASYFLGMIAQSPFVPVHIPSVAKFDGLHRRGAAWTRPENFVGNGAFMLKEWIGNKTVTVVKNPRYWNAEAVKLREIQFIPTEDANVEERGFRAGQFHITFTLPPDKLAHYQREHASVLHVTPALRTDYITFNVSRAPFTDARVRRALALAIDRDKLVAAVMPGLAEPLFHLTRDGTGNYAPSSSSGYRYDPAEGRKLLADAGYPDGSGMPSIELMLAGNLDYMVKVAEVLQDRWQRELGVHVTVQPTEFKVYLEAERTKKFQLLLEDWNYQIDDPLDPLQLAQTGNPNNDSAWGNLAYDAAYQRAEYANTPAERDREYEAMETILSHDAPYIPLYSFNIVRLVHPTVQGWRDNAINWIDFRELSLALP